MRVFITGATGLVGRRLVPRLLAAGHTVLCVTRDPTRAKEILPAEAELIGADPGLPGVWQDRAAICDAVVNLAGAPVAAGRWTHTRKQAIRRSRLGVTSHLARTLIRSEHPVIFVSASAAGYYGDTGDNAVGERAQPGNDFLARLAVEWEHTALQAEAEAVQVVLLRIGAVLAAEGGVLGRMLPLFRAGLGGPLGTGRQYLPWIHIEDVVGVILFILEGSAVAGPVNAAVPAPCSQREFARTLGRVLGKPARLSAPAWVLRMLLGEMAGMVLTGQRVVPNALKAAGYSFAFTELEPALRDLLGAQCGQPTTKASA